MEVLGKIGLLISWLYVFVISIATAKAGSLAIGSFLKGTRPKVVRCSLESGTYVRTIQRSPAA
jgi:hypothetical protein